MWPALLNGPSVSDGGSSCSRHMHLALDEVHDVVEHHPPEHPQVGHPLRRHPAPGPPAGAASAARRPASPAQRPRVRGRRPGAVAGRDRRAPDGGVRTGLPEQHRVDGDAPRAPDPRVLFREEEGAHRSGGVGIQHYRINTLRPEEGLIVVQASGEIDVAAAAPSGSSCSRSWLRSRPGLWST